MPPTTREWEETLKRPTTKEWEEALEKLKRTIEKKDTAPTAMEWGKTLNKLRRAKTKARPTIMAITKD